MTKGRSIERDIRWTWIEINHISKETRLRVEKFLEEIRKVELEAKKKENGRTAA